MTKQNLITQTYVKDKFSLTPPTADKIPTVLKAQGEEWVDDYAWMRDKSWPEVQDPKILSYLNAENAYSQGFFDHYTNDFNKIYNEIVGRIKLKDSTVPVKKDNYYYYSRTEEDSEHAIYCRKKDSLESPEEIIFDSNAMSKGKSYYDIGTILVSQDNQQLLYSEDLSGADRYTVRVKKLTSGETLSDQVPDTLGSVIWDKQGKGFFYAKLSDQWRTKEAYYHPLGGKPERDILLYREEDPLYSVGVGQSHSKKFLFITAASKDTSEVRYIDLDTFDPVKHRPPILIQARKNQLLYSADHHGELFYIHTNDNCKNFRLVTAPINTPSQEHWQEVIPCEKDKYLSDFTLYQNHLVLTIREKGLNQIKIINLATKEEDNIKFPDVDYEAEDIFTTFDAAGARISYSSLITPDTIFEYDFKTKKLNTLKVMEIPSGYNKDLYQAERIFIPSKDGAQVPISIVYKKDLFKKDGKNPLYLYGYGSYGSAIPSGFRPSILSLLDRGFVYAIAHIRGGDEMGYEWYESAKFLTKRRTFEDFIAAAEHLAKQKYTTLGEISITGRSAGGMLVGVCVNERPELYRAVVADVPFVDVLNTMLDDTLPLTPGEFKEWGNPKEKDIFEYMKSYSPYENVKRQAYPAMYVIASINDPRVTYWEPAKWVAKLREMKTNDNLLLDYTNMSAGHAGASGRFSQIKDLAKEYLFILLMFGTPI